MRFPVASTPVLALAATIMSASVARAESVYLELTPCEKTDDTRVINPIIEKRSVKTLDELVDEVTSAGEWNGAGLSDGGVVPGWDEKLNDILDDIEKLNRLKVAPEAIPANGRIDANTNTPTLFTVDGLRYRFAINSGSRFDTDYSECHAMISANDLGYYKSFQARRREFIDNRRNEDSEPSYAAGVYEFLFFTDSECQTNGVFQSIQADEIELTGNERFDAENLDDCTLGSLTDESGTRKNHRFISSPDADYVAKLTFYNSIPQAPVTGDTPSVTRRREETQCEDPLRIIELGVEFFEGNAKCIKLPDYIDNTLYIRAQSDLSLVSMYSDAACTTRLELNIDADAEMNDEPEQQEPEGETNQPELQPKRRNEEKYARTQCMSVNGQNMDVSDVVKTTGEIIPVLFDIEYNVRAVEKLLVPPVEDNLNASSTLFTSAALMGIIAVLSSML